MPLYNQGEDYEEGESSPKPKARSRRPAPEPEEEDYEEAYEEEETPKKGKKKKKQEPASSGGSSMNPKLIACIVGLVVLVILAISLFTFINGNKKKRDAIKESKAVQESLENLPPATLAEDVAPLGVDTSNDAPLGVDTGSSDAPLGGSVSSDAPLGGSSSSTQSTSSTSGGVGDYSAKTADTLRKWGYTNNQMEIASRDGISAEQLVAAAKHQREEAQYEAMMAMLDSASPEFQALVQQTWMSQPPMDITAFSDTNTMYATKTYTENVDYEKVEPHGMQLWIKVYLKNGMTAFMPCSPARYNQLDQSGNIVINYTVTSSNDVDIIIQINEQRVGD